MRKKRIKKGNGKLLILPFIILGILVIICGLVLVSRFSVQHVSDVDSIQLGTFVPSNAPAPSPIPTTQVIIAHPTPTSPPSGTTTCGIANYVVLETSRDASGNCCIEDGPGRSGEACCPGVPRASSFLQSVAPDAAFWCNAKPVIYLYPTHDTSVSVSLKVPGEISVSIPQYPLNGWNVMAHPNGTLDYEGKTYSELFYESSITPTTPPTKGFVIKTSDVSSFLMDLSVKLGLKTSEALELVSYWTPKLQETNKPYIFISKFDPETKDKIDHVEITPQPDTFIGFILYFKPLQHRDARKPLELIPAPERKGFTAVEWGGVIDNN